MPSFLATELASMSKSMPVPITLHVHRAGEGGDSGYDIYSRFFAPWMGIDEDPVTGVSL